MRVMISDSLLNGIAVVIDDSLRPGSDDPITDIVKQIEEKRIPVLDYDELPSTDEVKHFSNASFVLIDWRLQPTALGDDLTTRVPIGEGLLEASYKKIAKFILELRKHYFGPVFIFSQESEVDIKEKLKEIFKEVGESDCSDLLSYIFIKNKRALTDGKLFPTIDSWFEQKPSVYVIKKWDCVLNQSKTDLFWHLYSLNHNWPTIFWNIFEQDGTDPSHEIGNLLSKNLIARLGECNLEQKYTSIEGEEPSRNDIRNLLSGERYIPNAQLHEDSIHCGDLFYKGNKYYVNIRPECDCIPRSGKETIDEVELYLLGGKKLSNTKESQYFNNEFSNFKERSNCVIIPFIEHNDNIILLDIRLKDLTVGKYGEYRGARIGRLLPPYITQIRLKYSGYLQREGLTPTPPRAIYETDEPIELTMKAKDKETINDVEQLYPKEMSRGLGKT